MGKINKLWVQFHRVEAELEQIQKGTEKYKQKTLELLEIYEKIQKAELVQSSSWEVE